MSKFCTKFYDGGDVANADIRMNLITGSLEEGTVEPFLEWLQNPDPTNEQITYVPTADNTDVELTESIRAMYGEISRLCDEWFDEHLDSDLNKEEILRTIAETLRISDDTQSESVEQNDMEVKTTFEAADANTHAINRSLLSIYGAESDDMIDAVKESFGDDLTAIAYFEINSGRLAPQTNRVLNIEIKQYKEGLFRTIVSYLRSLDPDDTSFGDFMYDSTGQRSQNYRKVMKRFMLELAKDSEYKTTLQHQYEDRVLRTRETQAEIHYAELFKSLMADNERFAQNMNRKFKGQRGKQMETVLYTAYHTSPYYAEMKRYIKNNPSNFTEEQRQAFERLQSEVEGGPVSLLSAVNAFAKLVNFDSLLKETMGNQLSIYPHTEGKEVNMLMKYSYHKDTSHQRNGFQNSEYGGSDKYTSKFIKTVLNTIPMIDYVTGQYMQRRVEYNTIIAAVGKLQEMLQQGKLSFMASISAIRQADIQELYQLSRTYLDNPVVNLQRMLEILFSRPEGHSLALVERIANPGLLYSDDISTLRSIYDVVFDRSNPQSVYSHVMNGALDADSGVLNLLEGIAGYTSRNNLENYIATTIDPETREVTIDEKSKYFSNIEVRHIHVRTNLHMTRMSMDAREALAVKYGFKAVDAVVNNMVPYEVTIGKTDTDSGTPVRLMVPASLPTQLMATDKNYNMEFDQASSTFLTELGDPRNVNLVSLRHKLTVADSQLTEDEAKMMQVLQFLDDTLGMRILTDPELGLQVLETFRRRYSPVEGMNGWLEPLVKLGIRACYVNSQYIAAGGQNLRDYLVTSGKDKSLDPIYMAYISHKNKPRIFTENFNMQYVIASYADEVLNTWADAIAEQRGDINKATIKDKFNNSIPNYTVAKLGYNLDYYLNKQAKIESNVQSLMFVKKPTMIRRICNDLEVTNALGNTKNLNSFSMSELAFHSVFNRFYGRYLGEIKEGHGVRKGGSVLIQPTAYADKTTFMLYDVSTEYTTADGQTVDLMKADRDTLVKVYTDTLGDASKKIRDTSRNKMLRIAYVLAKEKFDPEVLEVGLTVSDVLHACTEEELVEAAQSLGLTVELNHDYRIVYNAEGKAVVGLNELLDYNADTYSDQGRMGTRLRKEEVYFVQQMLNNNCIFQVLTGSDKLSMYTGVQISENAKSRTPVLEIIKKWYSETGRASQRAEFFREWVDEKTGRLILAKQNGHNIISISDNLDINASVELNPLLERFFLVEGLFSNNLRYSLSGVETNHAVGKSSPLKKATSAATLTDWNRLHYGEPLTEEEFLEVHNMLSTTLDLNDLKTGIQKTALSVGARAALGSLYEDACVYESNTAQGTQYKRNVIIPATLQYCMQNSKIGIPPKIRCAVIRDEEAPVFNYKGDHEKSISPCDGAAYITSFQSILENRCLQDQAVGYNKKPIWHHYDSENGTAFLAKFATFTMTNAMMKASSMSTVNAYNLFKKATNIQWGKDVDLTRNMLASESLGEQVDDDLHQIYTDWIEETILGGKRLFYNDKYGNRQEIVGFDKRTLDDGRVVYYTLEKNEYQLTPVRVYHIFHDTASTDGSVVTSQHMRVSEEALPTAFDGLTNAHTINSLFELHAALGGLECVDEDGIASEHNNEVVVNFMCNVGHANNENYYNKRPYVDQTTYTQPLKDAQIGYLFNSTAVKNGAKNINQSSAWRDNSELSWFYVDSAGLGMQMNADHDVIKSELTEFSQVIAATAAYGFSFDQCDEIFHGLARAGFQASRRLTEAVDEFLRSMSEDTGRQEVARSDLYEAVGRIILANDRIREGENLTNVIIDAVTGIFNKYADHTEDKMKIPFSDDNIYGEFISTLGSMITSESIKRKHPGSGNVLCPGYDMMQYFEIHTADGEVRKMMVDDIRRKALGAYRDDLWKFFRSRPEYSTKGEPGAELCYITIPGEENPMLLNYLRLDQLEALALQLDSTGRFSEYYTASGDSYVADQYRMKTWLATMQAIAPVYDDKSWFMPTDIVDVLYSDGRVETVTLDSMGDYYAFKDKAYPQDCRYRVNVTRPHNLRPSLIRWQYEDRDGSTRYMNYFDLKHVKDAYLTRSSLGKDYRAKVQEALNLIQSGYFMNDRGEKIKIKEGTLENSEAELIQSNMYRDLFDTKNSSLNDILEQGEQYFQNQLSYMMTPKNQMYDVAFMRDDGSHTLLSFSEVREDDSITERNIRNTLTKTDGSIVLFEDNREQFTVGQWLATDEVMYNNESRKFEWTNAKRGDEVDQTRYRIAKDGSAQKRYDLVKKYSVLIKKTTENNKKVYKSNTLYRIADMDVFREVYGGDAARKMQEIVTGIYQAGDYKMAEVNMIRSGIFGKKSTIRTAMERLTSDTFPDKQDYVLEQLNVLDRAASVGKFSYEDRIALEDRKMEILRNKAHEKWVSFQDSQKFISSRIPAQTLQSFMAMRCVGWTNDTSNTSFVSHFQTYLQGSDYDIDKAYVMGQNYDSNSTYIKWSTYFDFYSIRTLEASKTLPLPRGAQINTSTESGANVDQEVQDMLNTAAKDPSKGRLVLSTDADEDTRVKFLNALGSAVRKIRHADGVIHIPGGLSEDNLNYIINTINAHELSPLPANIAEKAYKNVASANIYAVSHDIRNRDQAYTAIAMDLMREAADNSPKGERVATLSSFNPFAKYVMQRQNLVGKAVIGIAANGEKFFFNTYYYWTSMLKNKDLSDDDLKYLRFSTTLSRIKGRSKGTRFDPQMQENTVNHIPDLDRYDEQIRKHLRDEFGVEEEEYQYVDQKISQLLSAATDNAKELILEKINASTDFAQMFLYLIVTGYDINDIAAFMTSPTAEMISRRVSPNMFTGEGGSSYWAIQSALGMIDSTDYLFGSHATYDEATGEESTESEVSRAMHTLKGIINSNKIIQQYILDNSDPVYDEDGNEKVKTVGNVLQGKGLNQVMQFVIRACAENNINLLELTKGVRDYQQVNYYRACQDLISELAYTAAQHEKGGLSFVYADAEEFLKIFQLGQDMANITTSFLKMNQGLPTDELGTLKMLISIKKVFTGRERTFGIKDDLLYEPEKDKTLSKVERERRAKRRKKNKDALIDKLVDNNGYLTADEITKALDAAHENDMIGSLDPYRMMTDPEYRQIAKDYYNILKGTANIIDMMDRIPHYAQIMKNCRDFMVANQEMSIKSRLAYKLLQNEYNPDDRMMRNTLNYINRMMSLNFLVGCEPVRVMNGTAVGFDHHFDMDQVTSYDLSTLEGIAGFKHFVESEFVTWLQQNYKENGFVKHITYSLDDSRSSLTVDIDLMHPYQTATTRKAYGDILRGMAELEGVEYQTAYTDQNGMVHPRYTVADILQLYNLISNSNRYGSDRLTTTFKRCSDKNSILNRYLNKIASDDYISDYVYDSSYIDYQIAIAPFTTPRGEQYHKEMFIKVNDPARGYVIKQRNNTTGTYFVYEVVPPLGRGASEKVSSQQRNANFFDNCPFETPEWAKTLTLSNSIKFDGEVTPEVLNTIKDVLVDLTTSSKLFIYKANC